jgi:hypothetical protein
MTNSHTFRMKILELFSGTASFSKVAKERGYDVFTIDFDKQFNPDLCIDILDFDISMLPEEFKHPDIIWASPPCTTFSVASISTHWKGGKNAYIPKSKESKIGLKILEKTKQIIKILEPTFYIIENPRGVMRKFMPEISRQTVTYCQYGDTRMKPTDIWTNINWIGRRCKNRDTCHTPAPRGSKTGTQGLKGAKERSVIPPKLCLEILEAMQSEARHSSQA